MQHGQRQGRGDHRQAAARPDRHRAAPVRRQRHALLRPGARALHAGAARSERERHRRAGLGPRQRAPVPSSARAVLTVDLAALRANWARLNQASGRAECAGVIKADAYGLGLAPIAKALTSEGCKTFFVATVDEGRAAREVQPGATIYVLDGLLPGAEAHYAGFDLRPVLSSLAEVRDWAAYCRARGRRLAAAMHIDTGMNRLGMPEQRGRAAGRRRRACSPPSSLTLVMSHLACADEPDDPMNERQRAALRGAARQAAAGAGEPCQLRRHVPRARAITSIWCGPASRSTAAARTRASPTRCRRWCGSPPGSCRCARWPPAPRIGYGATYKVQTPARIATIAVRLCRRLPARLERGDRRGGPGRLHRRLSRADRRARVDGFHHRRRHRACRRSWRGAAPGWR